MPKKINNRKFMEMAIEEMKQSKSEHTDRPDPKVGAVIIDENGYVLGKNHRASVRDGEHAEYHLIDKELATRDLSNATLFVTLEPCTVRKNPKKPCAERIVRARINKVFIGIYDPHPDVQGRGAFLLSQNDIKLNYFDEDLLEVIKKENKDFIEYCLELENQDDKKNEESILFKNKYDLNIKPVLIDSERPYRILRIYPKFDSGHLFSISETQIEEELLIKYKKLFNWDKKYSIDKIIYSLFYFQGEEDSPTRNHSEICENGYVYYHEDCNEGGINLERTQQIYKEFLYFVKDFYNYINFKGDLILNCDFQNVLNQHLKSPKLQFELKNYKSSEDIINIKFSITTFELNNNMKQILRKIYSRFPLSFGLKLPQEVIEQEIEKIIK